MIPKLIELDVVVAEGSTGSIGRPVAFCRILLKQGVYFLQGHSQLTLVACTASNTWEQSERSLTAKETEELLFLLSKGEFIKRELDINGAESTADVWRRFDIHCRDLLYEKNMSHQVFSFGLGFEGKDASGFIQLMQTLSTLMGSELGSYLYVVH